MQGDFKVVKTLGSPERTQPSLDFSGGKKHGCIALPEFESGHEHILPAQRQAQQLIDHPEYAMHAPTVFSGDATQETVAG